jgi:DNA-3-methyladenine glycosylase II
MPVRTFDAENFQNFCDRLARRDADLRAIIRRQGYPPLWVRPNRFQTLVLTILEQQVSLASAYAAFRRLKAKVGYVTPEKILSLSDAEMRECYFTRQKMSYVRGLAMAVRSGSLKLSSLAFLSDEEVRASLIGLKGIGHWTIDVYLMHALRRTDLFPLGDIALVNSLRNVKRLAPDASRDTMLALAEPWRPYRTIAAMILWHDYIRKRGMRLQE